MIRRFQQLSYVALLAFPLAVAAEERVATLDPARTTVEFSLGASLHTVHGKFKLKQGAVRFDPAGGKASGELVVDATSGESGNGSRDGRMHKNILESKTYPEIVFSPDRVDGKVTLPGVSNVQVHGTFKIHGTAHEVTLPAKVEATGDQITVTTRLTVPYVAWGMKNPSTFLLRVDNKVEIEIQGAGKLTAGH